jgi:hypothetical protein
MHQKIVQQNQWHDEVHFGHFTARRRREAALFGGRMRGFGPNLFSPEASFCS